MVRNPKLVTGIVLLIVVSSLACIVTFAALSGPLHADVILLNFAWNIPGCLLVGAIDYKLVSVMFNRRKSFGLSLILLSFLLANVVIGLLGFLYYLFRIHFTGAEYSFLQIILPLILWNSILVLIIDVAFYQKKDMENKTRMAELREEKAKYQFEALKNQINPHFLFNSLNVLSSLAYKDPVKTNLFAKKLSSVYRYLLSTHERMEVPLSDELDFVKSYIYLEQIRFGETLAIRIEDEELALGRYIIPASIQMLVENALKHNMNTLDSPLRITIRIDADSVWVENNLQVRYSTSKGRIGLDNLKKQYALHGKQIDIRKTESEFVVRLPLL